MVAVGAVFKKKNGTLEISTNNFSFKVKDNNNVIVAFPLDSILKQLENKIDPSLSADKVKYLLRISIKDSKDLNFSFENGKDRENVINAIKEFTLGKEKVKSGPSGLTSEEISARQSILAINPLWARLHSDLVIKSKTITEEEFWHSREDLLTQQKWTNAQTRGTSSVLLSDLKPTASDSSKDLHFKLTADIIHSIFTTYPSVHVAYLDNVPHKMTEVAFWEEYFKSKYFGGTGVGAGGGNKAKGDFFSKYLEQGKKVPLPECTNLLVNLDREEVSEGGNGLDFTMKAGRVGEAVGLIEKFNRHSGLIVGSVRKKRERVVEIETEQSDLKKKEKKYGIKLDVGDTRKYFAMSSAPEESKGFKTLEGMIDANQKRLELESLISPPIITAPVAGDSSNVTCSAVLKSSHARVLELVRHFWIARKIENKERVLRLKEAIEREMGTINDEELRNCREMVDRVLKT